MSISSDIQSGPYTANGSLAAFPFTFTAVSAAEVAVDVNGVTISPSLYTVSLTAPPANGGTVNFTTAPVAAATVLIRANPDYLQDSYFENQGAYNLSTVNQINRRQGMRSMVTDSKASRAMRVPVGDGADMTLPAAAARADKLLGFGAIGGGAKPAVFNISATALETLAASNADIILIADNIGVIDAVGANLAGSNSIGTVAANIAAVNTLAGIAGAVVAVATIAANVTTVAGIAANVTTVAGAIANVNAVGGSIANVNVVATDLNLGASGLLYQAPGVLAAIAANAAIVTTSYATPGGTGNRTSLIRGRIAGQFQGIATSLFDGDNTGDNTHSTLWSSTVTSAMYQEFLLPAGYRYVLDEYAVRHATAHATGRNGSWRLLARNRYLGESWVEIAASTAIDPPSTSGTGDANVLQKIACTRKYANGQVRGFDSFRFEGVSGTATALDANRLVEIEFKFGAALDHLADQMPTATGTTNQVVGKRSADPKDVAYIDRDADPKNTSLRWSMHAQQESRQDTRRAQATYFLDTIDGSSSFNGASSSFAAATVAGIVKRQALVNASFVKHTTGTAVYKISIDKGALIVPGSQLILAYVSGAALIPQWLKPVANIAEVDATAVTMWDSDPKARVSDVYVQMPASSNPITDGRSYMAVVTPPKAARIAIRANTTINDRSLEPPLGYTSISAYGDGALPYFDCGKTLASGDWTLSTDAGVGGGSNTTVFECTVTREQYVRYLNDAQFVLYEIDTNGKVWTAEVAANIGATVTRPGAAWYGDVTTPATGASGAQSCRIFYRPRFTTDPRSDGKTYRYSYLKAGISILDNADNDDGFRFCGVEIEGIKSSYGQEGHGLVLANADALVRRCLSSWSAKHAFIVQSGRWEDCVAFGGYNGNNNVGWYAFTFYAQEAKRLNAVLSGCGVVTPDHRFTPNSTLYSHGSTANSPLSARVERFFSYNAGDLVASVAGKTIITDFLGTGYSTNDGIFASLTALQAVSGSADAALATINAGTVGNQGWYRWNAALPTPAWEKLAAMWSSGLQLGHATASNPNRSDYVRRAMIRSTSLSPIFLSSAGGSPSRTQVVSIKDSIVQSVGGYTGASLVTMQQYCQFDIQNNMLITDNTTGGVAASLNEGGQGTKFKRNILYDTNPLNIQSAWVQLSLATAPSSTIYTDMDYNVYIQTVAGSNRQLQIGGVNYVVGSRAQFVTYQAAMLARGLAIDQNSVWLSSDDAANLFVGNPLTGDFRLRSGGLYFADGTPMNFADGTPVNSIAGPQEHLDWNTRAVLPGAPEAWPIPPKTEANCELYCREPWLWDWYVGASIVPAGVL
ncbi:hypothetical protein QH494_15925 [Sphingomonas sp. AR_OL41]|uniref:hypothetical protein n=1 Tax=Sphingomonas sp. AR_OL41 TaxID=3042729 RepID=UPI00248100AA|nr:hypothetical protein [Sphingomonas sp. AR_OL41]MDH7973680.1 hypothetical protein [Sphingomonas sp. AR_OL41]